MGAGPRVGILGPVTVDGTVVVGREAVVASTLALRAPATASTDDLVAAVWGEEPPITARKALQNVIGSLRRRLGEGAVTTVADGYRLEVEVDLAAAEELHKQGRSREALQHWRGDPVVDDPAGRARIEELRAEIEDEVARLEVRDGDLAAAVARLEAGLRTTPYREPRWALLISTLGAAGRQGEALRAAQRARQVLGDDLGLEPGPAVLAAEREVLEGRLTPTQPVIPAPEPATPLLGRDGLLRETVDAVRRHRIVTLVGPGGVGKTRVALASAAATGACVVDLTGVARPERVWEAVASAAGIATPASGTAEAAVIEHLDGPIVLDNCEHVLEVASQVAELVRVPVLATSREQLGLRDEHLVPVPPLPPDAAVELYLQRADPRTAPDVAAVEELCARLDHLPLAIELAAAVTPALGPAEVLARLDDRFTVLDGRARRGAPRHRALRAVVEWSLGLLSSDEQLLFARLAAFRGRFSLADAEAVTADERLPGAEVAPALARLVASSMVVVEGSGHRRFRMLETFREHGRATLDDPEANHDRHLRWISDLARASASDLYGPRQAELLDDLATLLEDIDVALAWCAANRPASLGLRIAGDLYPVWMARGARLAGLRWLETFALGAQDIPPVDRCRALHAGGMMAMMADLSAADRLAVATRRIADETDDRDARALADATAAIGAVWRGDVDQVARLARSAMPVLDEPQHRGSMARLWDLRTWEACMRGDVAAGRRWHLVRLGELEEAQDLHMSSAWSSIDVDLQQALGTPAPQDAQRAVELARGVGCPSCEAAGLAALAMAAHGARGPVAAELLAEAIRLLGGIEEQLGLVNSLDLAAVALLDIDVEQAGRAWGAREALCEQLGIRYRMPGRRAVVDPVVAQVSHEPRWDAGVRDGRTWRRGDLSRLFAV